MVPPVIQSKSESLPPALPSPPTIQDLFCLSHAQHPPTPGPLHGLSLCWEHPSSLHLGLDSQVPLSDGPGQTAGPSNPSGHSLCSCSVLLQTDPHLIRLQSPCSPSGRKLHASCWHSDTPPGNTGVTAGAEVLASSGKRPGMLVTPASTQDRE